jgi:hypothetical protein
MSTSPPDPSSQPATLSVNVRVQLTLPRRQAKPPPSTGSGAQPAVPSPAEVVGRLVLAIAKVAAVVLAAVVGLLTEAAAGLLRLLRP